MECHIISNENCKFPILLDAEMRLVKPVYDFVKHIRDDGKKFNTLNSYTKDLKIFWEFLIHNAYEYDEIRPSHISEFRMFLLMDDPYLELPVLYRESARSPRTINRILGTVRSFYKYCCAIRQLKIDNPILMEQLPRSANSFKEMLFHINSSVPQYKNIFKVKTESETFRLLTLEQIEAVSNTIGNTRDKLIWKILATTGARIQEVLNLSFDNVPLPDSSEDLSILTQVESKGKKRDILIPTSVLIEVDQYIMETRYEIDVDHNYIFTAFSKKDFGKPLTYSACYQNFKLIQEIVGFKFNFHDLRHTFCTDLLEAGQDVAVVKEVMGHQHISTTQKYTHIRKTHLKKSLKAYWNKKRTDKENSHED